MPWLEPYMKDVNVSTAHETILTELRKYTQYRIQVLAYTRIGDGAISQAAPIVKTFEDGKQQISSESFFCLLSKEILSLSLLCLLQK